MSVVKEASFSDIFMSVAAWAASKASFLVVASVRAAPNTARVGLGVVKFTLPAMDVTIVWVRSRISSSVKVLRASLTFAMGVSPMGTGICTSKNTAG